MLRYEYAVPFESSGFGDDVTVHGSIRRDGDE